MVKKHELNQDKILVRKLQQPSLEFISSWYSQNISKIAGLDEAGRGPLAGPVVASAVVLDPKNQIEALNDSKKLSPKKRDLLFEEIQEKALFVGTYIASPEEIDEINILRASLKAMAEALRFLRENNNNIIGALVDGNQLAPLPKEIQQFTVIGGDAIFAPIMAASIVAKVTRDRLMIDYANEFPGYGFERHKGYGTKSHIEALGRLGVTRIHRKTFRPISELIKQV